MIKQILITAAVVATLAFLAASDADAQHPVGIYGRTDRWAQNAAAMQPWHGQYQYTPYASPVALVVPPTARMETVNSWGVSQNLMFPIYHQYGRSAPGVGVPGYGGFQGTPYWPSHTDQFGVYYVRGPWR